MIRKVKELIEKNSTSKVDENILEIFYENDHKEFEELYNNLLIIDSSNDFSPVRKNLEMRIILAMISLPKKVRDLYRLNPSNMIEKGTEPLYTMIRMLKNSKSFFENMSSKLKSSLQNILDNIFPSRLDDEIKEKLINCSVEMANKLVDKRCAGLFNVDVYICIGVVSLIYATGLLFYPDYSSSVLKILKLIKAELPDSCMSNIDDMLYDVIKVTDWIGCDVLALREEPLEDDSKEDPKFSFMSRQHKKSKRQSKKKSQSKKLKKSKRQCKK